jgi:ATP-dependent Clp protease protease subunit
MPEAVCDIPITCKGDEADVLIYQQIGNSYFEEGLTAKAFAENLKAMGKGIKTINVRINSPGGSVFDGTAIYNTLRGHGAKIVTINEGAALSIASLIFMAGDERRMAKNGYMMIHDPAGAVRGRAEDMRKMAEMLDKVKDVTCSTYADRSGHDKADIAEMMSNETWLTAKDAQELGFVDTVTDEATAVAVFDPQMFANVPEDLKQLFTQQEPPKMADPTPQAATLKELRAACPGADEKFLCSQLDVDATVAVAQTAWMVELGNRNKAIADELAKAKAAPPPPPAPTAGVDPLPAGGPPAPAASGDALEAFQEAVALEMKAGKPQHVANANVCRKHPELRKAFVAAHNAQHKPARR